VCISRFLIVSVWVVFFSLENVEAFPDTIRHGYANCTSCHTSPGGGGLLNSYGRSLSKELISAWGGNGEEMPLHGLVDIPEGTLDRFLLGGDSRYISRKTQGKSADIDEGFLMQAQVRIGFVFEKLKFLMILGKIENPRMKSDVRNVSPEYYALWSPKEELHIRAGRFEPIFGLRLPDHNVWTRTEAGLLPWLERDTVEFISEGELQFVSLAGFQSISSTTPAQQQTGYSASLYQVFKERYRAGFSMLNSEGQGSRSKAFSLNGTFGFTEKLYSMVEFMRSSNNGTDKDVGFFRAGYEIKKGFVPLFQGQSMRTLGQGASTKLKMGAGFQWFPRPHFEVMTLIENVQVEKENTREYTFLFHYYL